MTTITRKKLKHYDSYWKCKQSWLAAQKQQLDELEQLRTKVAELEAKLAKYENLEPVAWVCVNEDGECEQIDYGSESPLPGDDGFIPLYALEK